MSDDKLQEVKNNLLPLDIYLRESVLELNKDYKPKYYGDSMEIQHRKEIVSAELANITKVKNGEASEKQLFIVMYQLGVRLVSGAPDTETEKSDDNESPVVMAELKGLFVAEYGLQKDGLEQDALVKFAESNVLYHIWPYWREYVSSTVTRARLPDIPLSTIQV